jgi:sulfotransferase
MLRFKEIENEEMNSEGCRDYVKVTSDDHPEKFCVLLKKYQETCAKRVKNFKVYDDDVWVVSFPKCGTSWTIEMVWLIINNMDFEMAKKINADDRFPFLE